VEEGAYSFTFLVPYQGGEITLSQQVRADNRGVFTGSVSLPSDASNARRTTGEKVVRRL